MSTTEQLWNDFNGRNHAELAIKHGLSLQQVYRLIRRYSRRLNHQRHLADLDRAVTCLLANPHSDRFVQTYLHTLLVREAHSLAATDVLRKLAPSCVGPQLNPVSSVDVDQTSKIAMYPAGFPAPSVVLQRLVEAWDLVWRKCHSFVNSH